MCKRSIRTTVAVTRVYKQWRSQGGARGGDHPPIAKKNSLKKAKSVEKLGGGVHVTSSKLKLIKYVSTEENNDILEELDL
jgi:hypothetical protein